MRPNSTCIKISTSIKLVDVMIPFKNVVGIFVHTTTQVRYSKICTVADKKCNKSTIRQ